MSAAETRARPLRLLLRDQTREVHEALHRLPDFALLAESRIGRADYGRLLLRLHGFYAAIDPALDRAASRHAGVAGLRGHAHRAPALARDLAALDLQPARPATPTLPDPATPAALAGALYVLDGALIGGATLARAAGRLDWPAPTAFWEWCQAEGPVLWRRTLALIDGVDDGAASRAAAVATATALFQAFGEFMAPADESAG